MAGSVGTDASDDTVIEDMIESVSRYIDRETGRRFYPDSSNTDYYYTSDDSLTVMLPDFASINEVSVDYSATRSYTALTASDFDILPDNYTAEGLPINGIAISPISTAYFPAGRRSVKVNGKRGWATCPDDVKDATLAIVQNIYALRSGQPAASRVTVTAGGVVVRPEDVPSYAKAVIMHYRILT